MVNGQEENSHHRGTGATERGLFPCLVGPTEGSGARREIPGGVLPARKQPVVAADRTMPVYGEIILVIDKGDYLSGAGLPSRSPATADPGKRRSSARGACHRLHDGPEIVGKTCCWARKINREHAVLIEEVPEIGYPGIADMALSLSRTEPSA